MSAGFALTSLGESVASLIHRFGLRFECFFYWLAVFFVISSFRWLWRLSKPLVLAAMLCGH